MLPSIIELCMSKRVSREQFHNERESIECRAGIVTRSDFNLSRKFTNAGLDIIADIDVIVQMRQRRKIWARFSAINETSDR